LTLNVVLAFVSSNACRLRSIDDGLTLMTGLVALFALRVIALVKFAFGQGLYRVGVCGVVLFCVAAASAQSGPDELRSAGAPMAAAVSGANQEDCKIRLAALVRDLDSVLASDPKAINPVYEVFYKHFPVDKCKIEDVLAIAHTSRFFVKAWEGPEYHSIGFNSAGVSARPVFDVQISISKKTGNLELPFAKVNGY
jgi:hypothetical protein